MTHDTTIRPALTPEEWKEGCHHDPVECVYFDFPITGDLRIVDDLPYGWAPAIGLDPDRLHAAEFADGIDAVPICLVARPENRHALAALCLYEQPFGFTRAELETLIDVYEMECQRLPASGDMEARRNHIASVCEKINALLPPPE